MSYVDRCSECEDVFYEKALSKKFFQVPPKTSTVDGLVYIAFIERTNIFCSEKCRVVLDWHRASYPRLVLDGIKDLVDGEA